MSIAFVQRVDSGNNGSGSGSTSTVSITPTAGNLLLIGFQQTGSNSLVSVTDNNGTPVAIVSGVNNSLSSGLYYVKNAAAGAHSITVTYSSTGFNDLWVAEYSGINASSPIDLFGYGHGASGVVPTVNVTATFSNEMLVNYVHAENSTLSVGSGFTSRDTFDGNQLQDQALTNPGTYAAGSPTSASGNWVSLAVTLKGVSTVSSVKDSRNSTCGLVPITNVYPNGNRTVQGTQIYDVETSNNAQVPGTDSRAAGAPVDSRTAAIIPQNSRT